MMNEKNKIQVLETWIYFEKTLQNMLPIQKYNFIWFFDCPKPMVLYHTTAQSTMFGDRYLEKTSLFAFNTI